jgi:hypothetical protein
MKTGQLTITLLFLIIIYYIYRHYSYRANIHYNNDLVDAFDKGQIDFTLIKDVDPDQPIKIHQSFYNTSIYPDLQNLLNHDVVRDEIYTFIERPQQHIWQEWPEYDLWKNMAQGASWKVIPLMSFGKWTDKVILCPKLVQMLKNMKGLVNVGLSRFSPNTKLKLHKGWGRLSNNVLRCHYGIFVPDHCYLYVMDPYGNYKMKQENGKWIIFDDSLYHSAANYSKLDRVVLIIDIERPEWLHKGISDVEDTEELKAFIQAN